MKRLSIVIPVFNEETNIAPMVARVRGQLLGLPYRSELLFIDDGSSDGTLGEILKASREDPDVKYVSLTRNFGKEAAMLAGLRSARGDAVILMDGDLQHPPSLLGELVAGFEEGFDQVVAKRTRTGDSRGRRLASSLYYRVLNAVTDVEFTDGEGDFRLLSRKAADAVLSLSEQNRFSKGLFAWIGLGKKTICYENVSREKGSSKWLFGELVNYGIDGISSFNTKPLRICFYTGFFILFLSLVYIGVTFFQILAHGVRVPGYFTTISAVLLLGGVQLISLGVIGEYVGRIYNETKRRPHYLVDLSNVEEADERQFIER